MCRCGPNKSEGWKVYNKSKILVKLKNVLMPLSLSFSLSVSLSLSIYIYIHVCVCVCVIEFLTKQKKLCLFFSKSSKCTNNFFFFKWLNSFEFLVFPRFFWMCLHAAKACLMHWALHTTRITFVRNNYTHRRYNEIAYLFPVFECFQLLQGNINSKSLKQYLILIVQLSSFVLF